jgi:hypothetical protein
VQRKPSPLLEHHHAWNIFSRTARIQDENKASMANEQASEQLTTLLRAILKETGVSATVDSGETKGLNISLRLKFKTVEEQNRCLQVFPARCSYHFHVVAVF